MRSRTGTIDRRAIQDRLAGLRPAFAQSQHAGAGGTTFALPRPGPDLRPRCRSGQPRTERRDEHRAHPVRTPWNRVRARPEIIESTFDRVRYGFTTDFPYHILWW